LFIHLVLLALAGRNNDGSGYDLRVVNGLLRDRFLLHLPSEDAAVAEFLSRLKYSEDHVVTTMMDGARQLKEFVGM
jgi:hypothetical protein